MAATYPAGSRHFYPSLHSPLKKKLGTLILTPRPSSGVQSFSSIIIFTLSHFTIYLVNILLDFGRVFNLIHFNYVDQLPICGEVQP